MHRRDFLVGTLGAVGTAVLGAPSAPWQAGSVELYTACADLVANYRRLDNALGPGAIYGQALDHHVRLAAWLDSTTGAQWRQIAALVVDSADLIGWLYFDTEQRREASRVYRQAAALAHDLGDVSLNAYLIGRMSRTLSEAGEHGKALTFAAAAAETAGTTAHPAVRSWLSATGAYVHACLNDERSAFVALDEAAALLGRTDNSDVPGYIAFYDRSGLTKWQGHTLLALAERRAATGTITGARTAVDQTLTMWAQTRVRESAEVLTACASARLVQHEIAEAARLTGQAYDAATATSSPRNLRHVGDLRTRLSPHRRTSAVRDLDEHILTGR
jgi:hypothetical protein